MIVYKTYISSVSNNLFIKRFNEDGSESNIPTDERNVDYKEYLKWVAEGNVAEEWNPGGIE
jgi:hypothetical protein